MSEKLELLKDSSDESEVEFSINKSYADRYDNWRKLEELQKLKDLKKEVGDSSSSSSDDDEEPVIEKDFFRALSLIKAKDPRIYDKNYQLFKDDPLPRQIKEKKEKPMYMKDYERALVLERNGEFSDEELTPRAKTSKEEEDELKHNFKAAVQDSDDEEEDDGSSLLKVRNKSKEEQEKEDVDYRSWLETDEDMKHLNKVWNDPDLDEGEKFLRDYFLNKWYLEKNAHTIPTSYHHNSQDTFDATTLSEDERIIEEQEKFEHKYNHRFEEPDEEFIKRYPRITQDSLRNPDNKRKQTREERNERKKREKEQKMEDLKRLKALKRQEISEKFEKLKAIAGKAELNFDDSDIESDFDPNKHDQKMKELFDDDYYTVEEVQKPEFEYDEDLDDEQWDNWLRKENAESQNDNEVVDNDSGEEVEEKNEDKNTNYKFAQEMIDSTADRKKRRRKKSLFAQIVSQPKPLYDPEGKSFDEYLDEYYKLDYEDIIGDQPVRFKYRKVIPNNFGLSVDEILAAKDKELNRWCSIKKTHQYRRDDEELYDVQAFEKKGQNVAVKQRILASVYSQPDEEEKGETNDQVKEEGNESKRKKKRSKKKKKGLSLNAEGQNNDHKSNNVAPSESFSKYLEPTSDREETAPKKNKPISTDINTSKTSGEIQASKKRKRKKSKASVDSSVASSVSFGKTVEQTNDYEEEALKKENKRFYTDINSDAMKGNRETNTNKKRKRKKSKASVDNIVAPSESLVTDFESLYDKEKKASKNKPTFIESAATSENFGLKERTIDKSETAFSSSAIEESNEVGSKTSKRKRKKKKRNMNTFESNIDLISDEITRSERQNDSLKSDTEGDNHLYNEEITSGRSYSNKKRKKSIASAESINDDASSISNQEINESFPSKGNKAEVVEKKKNNEKNSLSNTPNGPTNKKLKMDAGFNQSNKRNSWNKEFHGKHKNKFGKERNHPNFMNKKQNNGDFSKKHTFVKMSDKLNTDKRLALSNERLAAFGINPKKFKNKIIYQKKAN